jgi:hypothetical protein
MVCDVTHNGPAFRRQAGAEVEEQARRRKAARRLWRQERGLHRDE